MSVLTPSLSQFLRSAAAILGISVGSISAFGQCGLQFTPASNITGALTRSVITADFNHDGKIDIAAIAPSTGLLFVTLGNGNGTFAPSVSFSTGATGTNDLVAGDFDGDGNIDIAVAALDTVVLMHGTGAGAFTIGQSLPASGTGLISILAADFDHDGIIDLVTANATSSSVSFFHGLGGGAAGTFSPPTVTNILLGVGLSNMITVDYNGDANLDLMLSFMNSGNYVFAAGDGAGGFTLSTARNANGAPVSMITADLNRDGYRDIVLANVNNFLQVINGTASGGFLGGAGYSLPAEPRSIITADLDSDGWPDMIVACKLGNVSVLMNTGTGTFNGPFNIFTGDNNADVAAGDFNNDGRPDLAVAVINIGTFRALISTVNSGVTISLQPVTHSVLKGQPIQFSVQAGGNGLTYQWRRGGVNLVNGGGVSGATSPTLTISPAQLSDNLSYFDVRITNPCGPVTSRIAVLGVLDCPADFNHDGVTDLFDYLDFVDAFSIGC